MENSKIFNNARQKAYTSLYKTIDELYGKEDISEKVFRNKWQENLSKEKNIIADGWYNPPPQGMAVLFGKRASFDSLRNKYNWPSDTIINWEKDLLYVYCSPIDKISGIIGDMSLTLYFGKDKEIRNHIKKCYEVTQEIFPMLENMQTSQELALYAEQLFIKHNLNNSAISQTDTTHLI